ncbi:MAG TPA: hypothetical protein VEA77_06045, partial [Hyphomicrobium sp.]|nr:hypothetical protein [Hyphomicrobium sp.]
MTRNQTTSQTIVMVAMGLVVGASAVALYQHAGLPASAAVIAAISAYVLLLSVHKFIWRGGSISAVLLARRNRNVRGSLNDTLARSASTAFAQPGRSIRPDLPPHATVANIQRGTSQGAHAAPQAPINTAPARAAAPVQQQPAPPPLPRKAERPAPPPLASAHNAHQAGDDLDDMLGYRPSAINQQKLPPF